MKRRNTGSYLHVAKLKPKPTRGSEAALVPTECGALLEGGRGYTEPIIRKLEGVCLF